MKGRLTPISTWSMRTASTWSDAQPLDLAAAEHEVEDHAGEQDGREHVRDQADAERDRESLDGSGSELEQEHRRDERGQVGVQDGAERPVVAQLDRLAHAALVAQLLAD